MLNQATADNIRNLNTHSTRQPAQVYDPVERKARLAAQVDNLCKHYGITQASEINAWVAMAIDVLQQNSAATAYDKTRKAIERALLIRALLPGGNKSRVNEQAHWARHAAEQRFIAKHQAHADRRKLMRRAGLLALASVIGLSAWTHIHRATDTGAQPGPIIAQSEIVKPLPQTIKPKTERRNK